MSDFKFGIPGSPLHVWDATPVNYREWVQRLHKFIQDLRDRSEPEDKSKFLIESAPPLSPERLAEIQDSLDCLIPRPLRGFLVQGSSGLTFEYDWDVGLKEKAGTYERFCTSEKFSYWRKDCLAMLEGGWVQEKAWALDRAFWRHALPVAAFGEADYLALWVHDQKDPDPPVLYLRHDGSSWLCAPSFDYLLYHWERLAYLSTCDFEEYCDPSCGFLDSTTAKARSLRKKFSLKDDYGKEQ